MGEPMKESAVKRCANEIGKAILYRRALHGLSKAECYSSIDFMRLAQWAMFDQMFAHAIKVIDNREKCGLFFLLRTCTRDQSSIESRLKNINEIEPKLRLIRDKTHFHLDQKGVRNPSEIWKHAGISGTLFGAAIDDAFSIISDLHLALLGAKFELPQYDGTDATRVAEAAYNQRLLQGQWKDPNDPSNIWD